MTDFGLFNHPSRDKWVVEQLSALKSGGRLIDIGAGSSPYKRYCEHLLYTAQDFCQYDGKGDNQGLQCGDWSYQSVDIVSDITHIPVGDETFDSVLCTEVLEHVPEPVKALSEMSRILRKTDATIILTVPFCSLTHQSPHFYSTGFSPYFFQYHLERFGFKTKVWHNGSFFEYLAQQLHLLPRMAKQYAQSNLSVECRGKILELIQALELMNHRDSGSKELLSFGLHVKATR